MSMLSDNLDTNNCRFFHTPCVFICTIAEETPEDKDDTEVAEEQSPSKKVAYWLVPKGSEKS